MGKTERFSLSFTVNNFSKVKKVSSPPVIVHNLKWKIYINATNIEKDGQQKKVLGYFLRCEEADGGSKTSSWSCQATAELRVMAVKQGVDNVSLKILHLFNSKPPAWGHKDYMDWADVESTKRGLIEDNCYLSGSHYG